MNMIGFIIGFFLLASVPFLVLGFSVLASLAGGAMLGILPAAIIVENVNGHRKSKGKEAFFR